MGEQKHFRNKQTIIFVQAKMLLYQLKFVLAWLGKAKYHCLTKSSQLGAEHSKILVWTGMIVCLFEIHFCSLMLYAGKHAKTNAKLYSLTHGKCVNNNFP